LISEIWLMNCPQEKEACVTVFTHLIINCFYTLLNPRERNEQLTA
jgi:hypothetical protein